METLYTGRVHGFPNASTPVGVSGFYGSVGEDGILSLIVVLTTSVSLVALVFAFITYSLFSDLRNLSGTTLMTLLSAIFMSQLIFVIGVGGVQDHELCLGIVFSLHYLHLSVLSWVTTLCHETWSSLNIDRTLRPAPDTQMCCKFLRNCLLCWGAPAVLTSLASPFSTPFGQDTSYLHCWFVEVKPYILTFFLPSICLLTLDVILLIRSKLQVKYLLILQPDLKLRKKLEEKRTSQLKLCCLLVVILFGVTGFGSIARLTGDWTTWAIFNISHSAHGLVVALCLTCDRKVLTVYTRPGKRRRLSRLLADTSSLDQLDWTPMPQTV